MKVRIINRVIFAALLVVALPSLSMAASPSQFEKVKIQVSYSDLNIHSEAGARVLYSRVERAAEKACSVAPLRELGSARRVARSKECFDHLVEKVVRKIDSDALQKIHAG